jgi:hypothetical protein
MDFARQLFVTTVYTLTESVENLTYLRGLFRKVTQKIFFLVLIITFLLYMEDNNLYKNQFCLVKIYYVLFFFHAHVGRPFSKF